MGEALLRSLAEMAARSATTVGQGSGVAGAGHAASRWSSGSRQARTARELAGLGHGARCRLGPPAIGPDVSSESTLHPAGGLAAERLICAQIGWGWFRCSAKLIDWLDVDSICSSESSARA